MHSNTTILYLSHGGGPRPVLGAEDHQEMVDCLHDIAGQIDKPDAIIVISAHWEEGTARITAGANPQLIYDYYGFPPESYEIQYPNPGEPALAAKIESVLETQGIAAELDAQRGFDHGMFIPLKIMYPDADTPCVQISMLSSLDPQQHIALGEALRGLNCENLLIIGSGFSFHNMRAFYSDATAEIDAMNLAFEDWLVETCRDSSISEDERSDRLLKWAEAPAARFCHPREEHLLPLHVCYGAAGRYCDEVFRLKILGRMSSMYLWSMGVGDLQVPQFRQDG
jgi:aromatic ring-opening dioxygenase catalytic subunit (LigB family)